MDTLIIVGIALLAVVVVIGLFASWLATVSEQVFGRNDDWLDYGQDEEF